MKPFYWCVALLALVLPVVVAGCTSDDAEDAASELGFNIEFDEGDFSVATPDGWHFLFAIELKGDNAKLVDKNFELDLTLLDDIEGVDLSEIDSMIAFAKKEDLDGYGAKLRYANKLIVKNNKLMLDTETLDKLGDSIGSSGDGWYAAYYADDPNGYIRGVAECNGDPVTGALAIITAGGFFTFTADDGSFALPTLAGTPGAVTVTGSDCVCGVGAPVGDTGAETNPKSDDPADTPSSDQFADGTSAVDAGTCVCCPPTPADDDSDDDTSDDDTSDDDTSDDDTSDDDTSDDDTSDDDTSDDDTSDDDSDDDMDDDMDDDTGDDDSGAHDIDFEDGLSGWQITSGCEIYGTDGAAYGEMFPGGDEANYLYVSSGGYTANVVSSCTMTYTTAVPSGATQLAISYNFISQEYEEWVGSMYNDIFTVIVQGAPDYLVNRTVNNIALDNDWDAIMDSDAAATIAQIGLSGDAQYNPTSTTPHSNGPYMLDGKLKWGSSDDTTPRGLPADENVGQTAVVDLPADMSTITIIVTVSDVGDKIYDSVGLVDWFDFE